jgi:glutaredoxin
MSKRTLFLTVGTCTIATLILCGQPAAQEVYRYVDQDGRVVYSDRAPTGVAKDIQRKRVSANTISTSEAPIAVQQATERYPVTLYTFACGPACDSALALLNRRGVPFTTVNVDEAEGQQKLQQVSPEMAAPVLQVGDKLIAKGWNESRWTAMLDHAGYPKSPARRAAQTLRPPAEAANAQAASEPRTASAAN